MGGWKARGLAALGGVARHVPFDRAQLFSFIASPSVRAAPWSLYRHVHERRGGVIEGPNGVWLVASHAEGTRILREAPTTVEKSQGVVSGRSVTSSEFGELMERTLLFTDPPDHTRIRRAVSRRLTPRALDRFREPVQELAEQSIAGLRKRGAGDLVTELALPFPMAVITALLGLPPADRDHFTAWARAMAPRLDISLFRDDAINEAGDRATREMVAYFEDLLDHPDHCNPEGLLVALLADSADGEVLQRDELIALIGLLLLAGFETTTNLIANSIHALLSRPEQLAAIRDGEVDLELAIEELLRHDGPAQMAQRVLLEDWQIGNHHLPAKALTAVLIGAANRDPHVFDQPYELDLTRSPNPHLSFSAGIHHCLGASLARLQAAAAIPAILQQLPGLELAGPPRLRQTVILRGFTQLPVRWRT
jgi:unspecific monooxygenase